MFRSGETLPELKLHYRTLGTAKRNAAGKIINGVLLLQGNTGTGANWLRPSLADELFRARAAARCGGVFHDHAGRDRARADRASPPTGSRGNFPATATMTWSSPVIG